MQINHVCSLRSLLLARALVKTFPARAMSLSIFLRYTFLCRCTWQDFFEREQHIEKKIIAWN